MALIKNELLEVINRLIGSPGGINPTTVLDDDSITQVLPIVPEIARRSLSSSTGWYEALFENVHAGADNESSQMDPYNPGAAAVAPYPPVVPKGWDIWLMGCGGRRSSGAGDLSGAALGLNPDNTSQGWGVDDNGAPVATTPIMEVAFFTGLETSVTSFAVMTTAQGLTYQPIGIRIPRKGILRFVSESGGAAEFQLWMLLGLFPEGLGQDVAT